MHSQFGASFGFSLKSSLSQKPFLLLVNNCLLFPVGFITHFHLPGDLSGFLFLPVYLCREQQIRFPLVERGLRNVGSCLSFFLDVNQLGELFWEYCLGGKLEDSFRGILASISVFFRLKWF